MNFNVFVGMIMNGGAKTFGFYDEIYRDLQGYIEIWKTSDGRLIEVTSTMQSCCQDHIPEHVKKYLVEEVSEFVERVVIDLVAMNLMVSHIENLASGQEINLKRYGDRVETIRKLLDYKVRPGIAIRAACGVATEAN